MGFLNKKELRSGASKMDALQQRIDQLDDQIRKLEDRLQANTQNLNGAAEAARTGRNENPKGGARRMKAVTGGLLKENNSIKKELAALKAKRQRLAENKRIANIKHQYAGESVTIGGNAMGNFYTDDDVKQAKLKIYESCRNGDITEDQKQELLLALEESVEEYNERLDLWLDQQEVMEASSDEGLDFNAMKVFVYESADQGLITEAEKEFMLQYL